MGFFDAHSHTPGLSYCCSPEVTIQHYADAIDANSWLDGVVITNHGFSSYFPPEITKTWKFMREPELFDEYEDFGNERIMDFVGQLATFCNPNLVMGMEVEMLSNGQFTLSDKIADFIDVKIGSLHWGPTELVDRSQPSTVWDYVLSYYERMLRKGVDVIAHPFRWPLKNLKISPDASIIQDFVSLLKKYNTAAEINGRFRNANDEFLLQEMLGEGVKIAFSSDAHRPENVGDFSYHFELLERLGLTLDDIDFWRPNTTY